uniref:NADH-ubiquinone oxidoreductase chain 5 n=1 Tax=Sagaminopteron nigropunctatum TaxID=1874340 RepID=E6Y1D4_9GAST|nr:NADH dehydrogenase subunit 5 [Sagaminopteron nigropunctatum]
MLFSSFFLFLTSWVFVNMQGSSVILEVELFMTSSLSFTFSLIFDKISSSFGMVVTLISASVFIFGSKYMEEDHNVERFLLILLAFVVSMNFLTLSGSLMFLLLGWDGLGITSFALIIYYQSSSSVTAGFQTLMVNRLGDALIVLSTFLFVLSEQFTYYSFESLFLGTGLITLLALAGLTKSAQYPFSSWLPAAMAAPTPVSALVHSSTLVTAGIFLIIRLSNNIPLNENCKSILIFLGAVTCLLGGWAATYENDLKKVIALSTLSQLGVMVFSLGLGLSNLALFHLYTHAMFKALLFLAAGNILMSSFGSQDIRLLGSVGLGMPFTVVMFNVSSLCLVGAPFLSAFYSKHLILEMTVSSSLNISSFFIMMLATFFTAKYVIRTLKAISWSKPISPIMSVQSNIFTVLPVTILSLGGIMGGKLMSSLDIFNLEIPSISVFWSSMINLVTISGMILGYISEGSKNNHFLSTLFFLSPSLSVKPMMFIKSMSSLDYGWLEFPQSVFIYPLSKTSIKLGVWPSKQVIISSMFIMITVYFMMYCCY